jgi:hypothetical protein
LNSLASFWVQYALRIVGGTNGPGRQPLAHGFQANAINALSFFAQKSCRLMLL